MLYAITNKKNRHEFSTCLTAYMVHYLFIDKKWNKKECTITSKVGHKMNYKKFNEINPL